MSNSSLCSVCTNTGTRDDIITGGEGYLGRLFAAIGPRASDEVQGFLVY
jgi:hypothetical protein